MPQAFSPAPLVVAHAIAGTIRFDIEKDTRGRVDGQEIRLRDIWPSDKRSTPWSGVRSKAVPVPLWSISPCSPKKRDQGPKVTPCTTGVRSTHPSPPHWEGAFGGESALRGMWPRRCCRTTSPDHLSFQRRHSARQRGGNTLAKMGLPEDFNSYATHRGDHLTAQRATFAPTPAGQRDGGSERRGAEGVPARVEPDGKSDADGAIKTYMARKQPSLPWPVPTTVRARPGTGRPRGYAAGVEVIAAEASSAFTAPASSAWGAAARVQKPGTTRLTLGPWRRDL